MKSDYLPHPVRSGIDTGDAELIGTYLNEAYTAEFSIQRAIDSDGLCRCSHSRIDVGRYAIEELRHSGDVRLRAQHVPAVVALSPREGRVESEYGELTGVAGPGEWVLASTGIDGMRLRLVDAQLRSVVLDRSLLAEAAASSSSDASSSSAIRFTGLTPTNAAMSRTLDAAERFLAEILTAGEARYPATLLESSGRMLASVILTAFPNEVPPDVADDQTGDVHPAVLRQALEFIHDNAARDIGVGDVAAAVYLTPRTVQYMFRRHLDTTPTSYLREVRLTRAHEELLAGDRGVTTVAATAARWGFAHTGRFAVLYRQEYGESPHETLRR